MILACRRNVLVLSVVVLAAYTGCGRSSEVKLFPVTGEIVFNGKPLPDASVTFLPEQSGPPAMGTTDENGRFTLMTHGRPGAVSGHHQLAAFAMKDSRTISPTELETMSQAELDKIRKSLIPAKYGHPGTSGLTATVAENPKANHFVLELSP